MAAWSSNTPFKIPFVPPKKVSFPEDPLPPRLFNDESSRKKN